MAEDHPLEMADIKAGMTEPPPPTDLVRRRQAVYVPIYGVIVLVLTFFLFQFATFSRTPIETVPNVREVVVYAPLTPTPFPEAPPTPTPEPVSAPANTWEGGISRLFQSRCAACHGSSVQLGNLNLSSYTSTLAGGASGPAVVPGDASSSPVILIQEAGGHPGTFTPDELTLIREWIEAGAPEN
jgi:hypothetical protein